MKITLAFVLTLAMSLPAYSGWFSNRGGEFVNPQRDYEQFYNCKAPDNNFMDTSDHSYSQHCEPMKGLKLEACTFCSSTKALEVANANQDAIIKWCKSHRDHAGCVARKSQPAQRKAERKLRDLHKQAAEDAAQVERELLAARKKLSQLEPKLAKMRGKKQALQKKMQQNRNVEKAISLINSALEKGHDITEEDIKAIEAIQDIPDGYKPLIQGAIVSLAGLKDKSSNPDEVGIKVSADMSKIMDKLRGDLDSVGREMASLESDIDDARGERDDAEGKLHALRRGMISRWKRTEGDTRDKVKADPQGEKLGDTCFDNLDKDKFGEQQPTGNQINTVNRLLNKYEEMDEEIDKLLDRFQRKGYDLDFLTMDLKFLKEKYGWTNEHLNEMEKRMAKKGQFENTMLGRYINGQLERGFGNICDMVYQCPGVQLKQGFKPDASRKAGEKTGPDSEYIRELLKSSKGSEK